MPADVYAQARDQPRRLHCPAKLNLTLCVGPPRADGLHPIASVMVAVGFGDTLTLTPRADGESRFERKWAGDAPKTSPIDWPIESDLIYRAHQLVQDEADRPLPIHCTLAKRIPTGAGLGGGSSNAAAMLVGLRDAFALRISDDRLIEMGQSLGADIAFAIHAQLGRPAALVTGIGEQIEPLLELLPLDVVLVFPNGACPTGAVYAAFDAGRRTDSWTGDVQSAAAAAHRSMGRDPGPLNDLEQAAIHVCPPILEAADLISRLGGSPRTTGSGSCQFVATESQASAHDFALQINQAGLPAVATRFEPGRPSA